jgi:site-specific DNA recombinase
VKAEREGFANACFRNLSSHQYLTPNVLSRNNLAQSGRSPLILVIPGCGVGAPGQIRDKFLASVPLGESPARPTKIPEPLDLPLLLVSVRRSPGRRRGPRSREEVEAERRKLHDDTEREIDALVAEFHSLLPRDQAKALGAIYARYSTRFQHSVADQVRGCLQAAVQQGIFVPRENILFDLAIRGAKQRRPGFDRLKELLAGKRVQALLILTTNRVARKTYKALQFVEEEVVGRGVRCLFVKSGVDSADTKRWRMLLNYHAGVDEFVTSMYAENIRVAQEGLFRLKLVFGTITFGYRGKEVVGPPTRQKRPRREYEIDPETAEWVRKIFQWYVRDSLPIAQIIRRLNEDPSAPLGPKAMSGRWTRLAVKLLLANPRYRGHWQYGKTQAIWQVQQDYTRQIEREQPLALQQFEQLRIIGDEIWYAAARRLATEKATTAGRKPKDGDRKSRPRLLNGIFFCATHVRRLYVGGAHGKVMICPECLGMPVEQRPLFSHLNRVLALRLTCEKLADLVKPDDELIGMVIDACKREAGRTQQPDPRQLVEIKRNEQQLTGRIKFVMNNVGESEADQKESAEEMKRLRRERAELQAEIARLECASARPIRIPGEDEIRRLLAELGDILATAASTEAGEDIETTREVIKLLTGSRIDLCQQGERKAQRGWLQGRFKVHLLPYLLSKAIVVEGTGRELEGTEIVIDYRAPSRLEAE